MAIRNPSIIKKARPSTLITLQLMPGTRGCPVEESRLRAIATKMPLIYDRFKKFDSAPILQVHLDLQPVHLAWFVHWIYSDSGELSLPRPGYDGEEIVPTRSALVRLWALGEYVGTEEFMDAVTRTFREAGPERGPLTREDVDYLQKVCDWEDEFKDLVVGHHERQLVGGDDGEAEDGNGKVGEAVDEGAGGRKRQRLE